MDLYLWGDEVLTSGWQITLALWMFGVRLFLLYALVNKSATMLNSAVQQSSVQLSSSAMLNSEVAVQTPQTCKI